MMPQRVAVITLVVLGLWIAAWATGVTGRFTSASVRGLLAGGGLLGIAAFAVAFSAGQLLRVPSFVFVAGAVAVCGRDSGILVALFGALISAIVSFAVVRTLAGQALVDVQRPLALRLLRNIDRRPVLTVALLRLTFQTAPPLNYALPMTAVGWRHHLIGSVLGLPVPVIVMGFFFDLLLNGRV